MPDTRTIWYDLTENAGHVTCMLRTSENGVACTCGISVDYNKKSWDITKWETRKDLRGTGLGKAAMLEAMRYIASRHGLPQSVTYTWNGVNAYVLEWLEKRFDAECTEDIAVQKYQAEEDWSSHRYRLDRLKVLSYFRLVPIVHYSVTAPGGHAFARITVPENVAKETVYGELKSAYEALVGKSRKPVTEEILSNACRQNGWYWRPVTPDTKVIMDFGMED